MGMALFCAKSRFHAVLFIASFEKELCVVRRATDANFDGDISATHAHTHRGRWANDGWRATSCDFCAQSHFDAGSCHVEYSRGFTLYSSLSAMTQTYQKIQRQIEALQRQAEKLKHQEVAEVVARIKVAIDHYGLTAEQLGFGGIGSNPPKAKKLGKSAKAKSANAAAYVDGQGNEWGGRGPRPRWLRDALAAGRSIEEFSAKGASTKVAAPKSKKTATKRTAKQYKDASGNQWSGFGPKPRWLKEQLAAGASLEQFAV